MKNNKDLLKKIRHPAETPLTVIATLITVGAYFFVSYLCINAATDDDKIAELTKLLGTDNVTVKSLIKFGNWAIVIIIIFIILNLIYIDKSYIGKSSVKSVRLKDSKYSSLCDAIAQCCEKLGIKKVPIAYIESAPIDSSFLGIKIRSNDAISIKDSELRNAEKTNDFSRVEYLIARSLAKIYLGHNSIWANVFTFISKLTPGFNSLYERVMCYSVDNVVKYLIGKEAALKGVFDTYYGNELYDDTADMEKIIKDKIRAENKSESFGRFLENVFADKPLPNYRLEALIYDNKNGKLF